MKRGTGICKSKRAQFYILAAAIIVAVVVGIGVLLSYQVNKQKPVLVYDLSKELDLEVRKVVDYGVYSEGDIKNLIRQFTGEYAQYIKSKTNVNWYLIYGDKNGLYIVNYTIENMGAFKLGQSDFPILTLNTKGNWMELKEGHPYTIEINGVDYTFKQETGKVFYFVLEEYTGEEKYVVPG